MHINAKPPFTIFICTCHSHIINKNAIEKYMKGGGGQVLMKNGAAPDVSRRKKEECMKSTGY
ncbi:MAG TPA: hypothetical protein VK645_19870 [Chitinophagaceae bacterium]|nr:hypothetical protein [Chitinophagaceae bacterium]